MKTFLYLSSLCFILGFAGHAAAQDSDAPKPSMQDRMLASLTADEKAQYEAASDKAMAADPSLKTQHDSLMAQGKEMHSSGTATTEDKMAFGQKMKAFKEKMRAAMLKQDSTLQPIFDKLDKAQAAAKAKRAAAQSNQ